jgi:hypothetical protein
MNPFSQRRLKQDLPPENDLPSDSGVQADIAAVAERVADGRERILA